jgi:hypothetical protein
MASRMDADQVLNFMSDIDTEPETEIESDEVYGESE